MSGTGPIYLDYNASTPVPPRVREAMMTALTEGFGNPSAPHVYGRLARAIVEEARDKVARLLGCDADEIVLTSGGTEANNLALRGLAEDGRPMLLVTSAVEHPATREPARVLGRAATRHVEVPVDAAGLVDPEDVRRALLDAPRGGSSAVSVLLAQNETGALQPLAAIAAAARERGALVHTDAAQAVGKVAVNVRALGVDLLSVAGHKLYAPKGVGALFVRRGVRLGPVLVGSSHEHGLRPGTENVPGIAALGEACALASEDLAREGDRQRELRDRLEARLAEGGFVVHGAGAERLPNTVNGRFPGVRGSALLGRVTEVAFSTGSACHAGEEQPSAALLAMGLAAEDALGAVRLTLGRGTRHAEIERAADALLRGARELAR